MCPTIVIVTEGGLIQQIIASENVKVVEVSYDKDEIADKEVENPTRISEIDCDRCVVHEWTTESYDIQDEKFIESALVELAKQKAAHDYLK